MRLTWHVVVEYGNHLPILFIGSSIDSKPEQDEDPLSSLLRRIRKSPKLEASIEDDDEGEDFDIDEDDEIDEEDAVGMPGLPHSIIFRSKLKDHNARVAAQRQALAETFSQSIEIRPPTDARKREKWNMELAAQTRDRTSLNNALRIVESMFRANIRLALPAPLSNVDAPQTLHTLTDAAHRLRDLLLEASASPSISIGSSTVTIHHPPHLTNVGADLCAHRLTRAEVHYVTDWAHSRATLSAAKDAAGNLASGTVVTINDVAYALDLLRRSRQPSKQPSVRASGLMAVLSKALSF
jgi:hypothetical protein